MPPYSSRRASLRAFAFAISLVSCGDPGQINDPPGPPGYLNGGVWFMHTANDSTLPAVISTRTVGVALEQTILDSARLVVETDGSWVQRHWYRVLVTSTVDRVDAVYDIGSWVSAPNGYVFTSRVRPREFTITAPLVGVLESAEPILSYVGAPIVTGRYQLDHP